jgi:hypothetical protein
MIVHQTRAVAMRSSVAFRYWSSCILVLSATACDKPPSSHEAPVSTAATGRMTPTAPGVLMGERNRNRVYFVNDTTVTDSSLSYVVWEAEAPSSAGTWKSANTYGDRPKIELADVDGDGALDLFWAMQSEDNLEGMVVLNKKGQFVVLTPRVKQCQLPELYRDNGRYVYVVYAPGAYSLSECLDPVVGLNCAENFHANWARFYAVDSAMREIAPSKQARREQATRYRSEANRFDSLYAADTMLPEPKRTLYFCSSETGQRMRRLADSVDRLASR